MARGGLEVRQGLDGDLAVLLTALGDQGWHVDAQIGDVRHLAGHRARTGATSLVPATSTYLELVAPGQDVEHVAALGQLLGRLSTWHDRASIARVAEFLLGAERTGPVPSEAARSPDELGGWDHVDLWLFSSVAHFVVDEGCPIAVHNARVVAAGDAFVCVWVRVTPEPWEVLTAARSGRPCPEPLPERVRRHSYTVEVAGGDGRSELARLVQDLLQHHEWSVRQLSTRLEWWERSVYRNSSRQTDRAFPRVHLDRARQDLAAIAEANLALRSVIRDLERRARLDGLLAGPDCQLRALREEVADRTAELDRQTEEIREAVRDGFALLSSAAAGAQVELQQSFQVAAGLVAGLVLLPGLVLSLYGAAVAGLPGQGVQEGLAYAGAYSGIGAVATIAGIYLAHRRRWVWVSLTVLMALGSIVAVTVAA